MISAGYPEMFQTPVDGSGYPDPILTDMFCGIGFHRQQPVVQEDWMSLALWPAAGFGVPGVQGWLSYLTRTHLSISEILYLLPLISMPVLNILAPRMVVA